MEIYICLSIILLFCASLGCKNLLLYLLIYAGLFYIGAFRDYTVGADTLSYYNIFNYAVDNPNVQYMLTLSEPSWALLNLFVATCQYEYRTILYIGVFLSITPVFIRVWKSCDRPFEAILFYVLLYFYFNCFNGTRQMIAISFVFYAYEYILSNHLKKYYWFVVLAATFHYTALVGLFVPVLNKLPLSKYVVLLILPLSYFAGIYVVPHLMSLLTVFGKFGLYAVSEGASGSASRLLLNIFFVLLLFSSNKKDFYLKCFFIGILIYNLFCSNPAVGRMALYFTICQLFIYSNFVSVYKSNIIFMKVAMIIYGFTLYLTLLNANSGGVVPYELGTF